MGTQDVDRRSGPRSTRSRPGGWRDYVTLLHPPYTAWHLSYVALGAALAPHFHLDRMLWTMAAFALAMGVAAHALDELNGRPLRTQIGTRDARRARRRLARRRAARSASAARSTWGYGLLAFVAVGAFLVPGLQPRVVRRPLPHRLVVRARVGRRSPALTGFFVEAQSIRLEARARGRVRDRAEPRPADALDAGAPRAAHARRHGRDRADGAGAARADRGRRC